MLQNKRTRGLLLIMLAIFIVTFYFGVFANPHFSIYDFCMNLASEILGLTIAVVIVDTYVARKKDSQDTTD